jgi:tetratricopeptide (TPR) repeat protein
MDATKAYQYALPLAFASVTEAKLQIQNGEVVAAVFFASSSSIELSSLLSQFKQSVGAIPILQAVVCSHPSPLFLSELFEFGIEQFFSVESWAADLVDFTTAVAPLAANADLPEAKAIALSRAIESGDQAKIKELIRLIEPEAKYDYVASYAKGRALEAVSDFEGAAAAFSHTRKLNKLFRIAITSLGENHMISGRIDEAIALFESLERVSPQDASRKATLATAYDAKGDKAKAAEYTQAAEKLFPAHPRVIEARAQMLLSAGKIGEAFKIMDNIVNAGAFFAAKLNEMGIKLSLAGKGENALALYEKAHRVVRPELRYKISLNAALASHRLNDFQNAMVYLDRSQKEYGGTFEKLEKIRQVVKKNLAGNPAA